LALHFLDFRRSFSVSTDVYADTRAIAVTGLSLAKVKRTDRRLTRSIAGWLAQNLQWKQAAPRKTVPTKKAPMPPTIAKELPPERPFSSA
jgi:hypothetical protein